MQKRSKFQVRSDAAKQRWVRDDHKEAFWRKHKESWEKSGKSKRAYCMEHNLSQSSFNAWNREITIRDREKVSTTNARELLAEPQGPFKNPFVPLRLLSDEAEKETSEQLRIDPAQHSASGNDEARSDIQRIEILVPGGAVIRVNESCSVKFLGELFSTLKGQDQC